MQLVDSLTLHNQIQETSFLVQIALKLRLSVFDYAVYVTCSTELGYGARWTQRRKGPRTNVQRKGVLRMPVLTCCTDPRTRKIEASSVHAADR
eukprot:1822511-Rhodomonas_salina.2